MKRYFLEANLSLFLLIGIYISYQLELHAAITKPESLLFYNSLLGINLGKGTYSTTTPLLGISLGFSL